jgi:methylmalonyl-CoA mutase, N-terminal domain
MIEALTREMQHDALEIAATESGFFRREIADAAFAYQRDVDGRRKLIVGVNAFVEPDTKPMPVLTVDGLVEQDQIAALRATRSRRAGADVERWLGELGRVAATKGNLMDPLLGAAHARASVGEIMNTLAAVFGRYEQKSA